MQPKKQQTFISVVNANNENAYTTYHKHEVQMKVTLLPLNARQKVVITRGENILKLKIKNDYSLYNTKAWLYFFVKIVRTL